jgi:hypothetical protein
MDHLSNVIINLQFLLATTYELRYRMEIGVLSSS